MREQCAVLSSVINPKTIFCPFLSVYWDSIVQNHKIADEMTVEHKNVCASVLHMNKQPEKSAL